MLVVVLYTHLQSRTKTVRMLPVIKLLHKVQGFLLAIWGDPSWPSQAKVHSPFSARSYAGPLAQKPTEEAKEHPKILLTG